MTQQHICLAVELSMQAQLISDQARPQQSCP